MQRPSQKSFRPAVATLGPQIENPKFTAQSNLQFKSLLDNPIFLGVVICLMIVVLGLLLFGASRQIANSHEKDTQ